MTQERPFEEILDQCVERALAGEPLDDILRDHPQHAGALRPLLEATVGVTTASAATPPASSEARTLALNGMVASIETERSAGRSRAAGSGSVGMMMGWFRSRPMAGGLALLGGIALLGAVAAGASAAGTGPKPVREFFGFQSDSSIRVEFEGVIRGVDTAGRALTVESGADVRTVVVTDTTELSDGGAAIAFASLAAGQIVEVKGTLQVDNTILASRVHREDGLDDDDDDDSGTPVATPDQGTPAPAATPFDDDDDDDRDDDHSGPGSGGGDDDDGIDDDNSGPGGGDDDDGFDDDNSGPGGGDDDDGIDDDNSGPGGGDDDDGIDDDNSGPGGGDDDDDSGAGSDDNDDDDSGAGSDDDDDDDDDDGGDDD